MLLQQFGSLSERFILNLVDEMGGYSVIDNTIVPYLEESCDSYRLIGHLYGRDKLLMTREVFEEATKDIRNWSHELKRRGTHDNAKRRCVNSTGAQRLHSSSLEEVRCVRDMLKVGKAHYVDKLIKGNREAVTSALEPIFIGEFDNVHPLGKTSFIDSFAGSYNHPVTLLTRDSALAENYVRLQEDLDRVGKRVGSLPAYRFELALLFPDERAFAYYYPELVRSEKFEECRKAV